MAKKVIKPLKPIDVVDKRGTPGILNLADKAESALIPAGIQKVVGKSNSGNVSASMPMSSSAGNVSAYKPDASVSALVKSFKKSASPVGKKK